MKCISIVIIKYIYQSGTEPQAGLEEDEELNKTFCSGVDTPTQPCQTPMGAQHPHTELGALRVTLLIPRPGFVPPQVKLLPCGCVWSLNLGQRWFWERGPRGHRWPQHWQGTSGSARAAPVTAPLVLSPVPGFLCRWGCGWRGRVPRATRVTRATLSPLAAKCCVSSVGVDLRYHLAAALPPLSPAQSVSPQSTPSPPP